jgi:hypothetical protein
VLRAIAMKRADEVDLRCERGQRLGTVSAA